MRDDADPGAHLSRPRCHACGAGEGHAPRLLRKLGTAYVVVRAVRLLQAHAVLPGHGGLEVRGVHVHHVAYGALLVAAQQVVATRRGVCLHRPVRANVLCTGAALMLEEFDVLTRTERRPWTPVARVLVDSTAAALAVAGLTHPVSTWRR